MHIHPSVHPPIHPSSSIHPSACIIIFYITCICVCVYVYNIYIYWDYQQLPAATNLEVSPLQVKPSLDTGQLRLSSIISRPGCLGSSLPWVRKGVRWSVHCWIESREETKPRFLSPKVRVCCKSDILTQRKSIRHGLQQIPEIEQRRSSRLFPILPRCKERRRHIGPPIWSCAPDATRLWAMKAHVSGGFSSPSIIQSCKSYNSYIITHITPWCAHKLILRIATWKCNEVQVATSTIHVGNLVRTVSIKHMNKAQLI